MGFFGKSNGFSALEMSPEGFSRSIGVLETGIREGVAPGMLAAFWSASRPGVYYFCARGDRSVIPDRAPVDVDTVFDFASVSKVVATTAAIARLRDRGWIGWDTPLRAVLPRFRYTDITVRHLLSHTSGLPAWKALFEEIKLRLGADQIVRHPVRARQDLMRDLVYEIERVAASEIQMVYSDISFLLLGFVIEELCGKPLDTAVAELVWEPLGLLSRQYGNPSIGYRRVTRTLAESRDLQCAATENCPWRGGVLQGQVHDDNTWCMGGFAGHAGVFGTARDLLVFARGIWEGGFFTPETTREMATPVHRPLGCSRALGWDTPSGDAPSFGSRFSRKSIGHLGYTGTSLWLDVERGIAVTLLTNRLHPFGADQVAGTTRQNEKIRPFRGKFHDALFDDLKYSRIL
ncbi:MAG: serine hydrolase domain-containing protein [Bdellovibrionota bacterium]